jgi:hypothetical protein
VPQANVTRAPSLITGYDGGVTKKVNGGTTVVQFYYLRDNSAINTTKVEQTIKFRSKTKLRET